MKLTEKQKRFAAEYLTDLNGTQAAIRAGYSAKTAGQMAEKLLKKGEIQSLVQQGMGARAKRTAITQDYVLQAIHETAERCRQMLYAFIRQAGRDGLRNLIIIHGKGRDQNAHPNVIRSYLARWLTEFEEVQAFCVALPHHGGSGACYVSLRKSNDAKQENWERHAKRSR